MIYNIVCMFIPPFVFRTVTLLHTLVLSSNHNRNVEPFEGERLRPALFRHMVHPVDRDYMKRRRHVFGQGRYEIRSASR
jgi:hypothetical protein